MNVKTLQFSLIILIAAFITGLNSCKKEDPEPASPGPVSSNPPVNSFSAKVDGNEFQEIYYQIFEESGGIFVEASRSENESIAFFFPSDIVTGTYVLEGFYDEMGAMYAANLAASDLYMAAENGGTLNITQHDTINNIVQGTFSFDAVPMDGGSTTVAHIISQGTFSGKY